MTVQAAAQEADFKYYLNIVLKHFWLIAAVTFLCAMIALMINIFMRPQYKASVMLMIDREKAGQIEVTEFTSWSNDEDYYRTQYKLLESRTLLEEIYKRLDLSRHEEFANPDGLKKFQKKISVEPITKSRLLNLSVTSYDPILATEISNTLAETFVTNNLSSRISIGQDVINALESSQKNSVQQELLNSMPQVVNSDFIKNLKHQRSSLVSERAKLSAKYTDNHPDIISLNNQIKAIDETINRETGRIVQSIKIELSGQFSGNNIRIIDEAVIPTEPVKPRKLINLFLGVFGGFMLGIILSFLMEFSDHSIRTSEDLENKLQLPFLGFVPETKKRHKKDSEYTALLKDKNVLFAENIRNIRTMLNFALGADKNAPFFVTSALQGEGKSNLSSNLAVAIAQTGKKILLIDGDMRRGRLHKIFKISIEKGLSNIWSGDEKTSDYASNIQSTEIEGLSVMTSGVRPPNPAELLNTPKLHDFVQWAVANYDQVIVDSPALMPISDTLLWGRYIRKAVFVIKYSSTNSTIAKSALEKLNHADIEVMGAVISSYKLPTLSYGKYHYYGSYEDKK